MSIFTFGDFKEITSQVIGEIDLYTPNAEPNPWFCKNINRKNDLQWAGYLGQIGSERKALAFGLNLEFTPAWRRVLPKIKSDFQYFSQLLSQYANYEWHWWGRPGVVAKNPKVRVLATATWTNQVDLTSWLSDLEDILEKRKKWSLDVPMRPQIQVMRQVSLLNQIMDSTIIGQNIKQIEQELKPLVNFLI